MRSFLHLSSSRSIPIAITLGAVAFLLARGIPVQGATRFWDGSVNGNLSTPGNWLGDVAPVAGDVLVFQSGVTRLLVTNNFSPNRAWNSILFQGSNYFLRGNAILVSNGVSSVNPVGRNTIDADVNVRSSQSWEAQGSLATIDVNGDIDLNANTLTVRANTGDFFFSGVVSGTGNLVKTNVGTLRLDGSGHNTYSGFTRFDGGVLELAKFSILPSFSNYTAIAGELTIGDGNGLVGTDVLRLLSDDQIADTSDVFVRNSGLFDLNGNSERIASLTMKGGTVDSGSGVLILGGDLTTVSDANSAFINGHLSLGGASRTFSVNSGLPATTLRINARITGDTLGVLGTAGFTKMGGGNLVLAGTNSYNGTTTINDGQVTLLTDRALGATATPLGFSAGTVINRDGSLFLAGVQVTNEDLTINSSNPGGALGASSASIWTGDIVLNTDTFIGSFGSLLLNGAVSGTGGFTKINIGSLTLAGTNANTYTGTTRVRDGTLLLDKSNTTAFGGAMSGPLVIGENELPENTDIVRCLRCCQLPDDTDVTLNASGLFDLNGFGENVHDLIFNGGDVDTGTASILPTGGITVNANTNSMAVIDGHLSVDSDPIINVTGHYFSPDLRIAAQVFGVGGFTKNGVGELALTAANTFSGQVIVNDGFVGVDDSFALGSTAGGTVVRPGAVLALRFNSHVPGEALTLAGTGQSVFGALSSSFGSNSWAGNITLSADATIYADSGDFLNLSGGINGGFDIAKTGTGTLMLSGGTQNDFDRLSVNSGTVILNKTLANAAGPAELSIGDGAGTDILRLARSNQVADNTPVQIATGGRFDLNDLNDTVGAISGRGVIDLGQGILREGADNASSTFSGAIVGADGCALFKVGLGTWTLNGDSTYPGQTTVSAGTLVVNGTQPRSPVTVNGSATLGGSGVVGDLQIFGSLRPGASPGILTSSNVNFAAQGDYFVELNGPAPGSGHDQLNVRGTNQLGGSTLHVTVGPGFAPAEGDRLTILSNDGAEAIQGTFNGLPNGAVFTAGGLQFRIRYSDIFQNDVLLVVTNTALELGGDPVVETGNGNGEIEPGECNLLRIALHNKTAGTVSGVSATLTATTPGVTVTQPQSTYPSLPPLGTATNSTPFQISTSPSLICGTNLDFVLTVHTAANGNFSIPIRMFTGAAGAPARFNRTGDQSIPDVGTLNSSIAVSGVSGGIHHVVVSLHLSHTADDNLDISLESPSGVKVNLSSDNGGTFDDYGTSCADADRTTFDDAGFTPITAALAPFAGTFRPEEPLSVYRGRFGSEVNGTWHLNIADDTAGGLGTLHCWSLTVFPAACSPGGGECDTPCPDCLQPLTILKDPAGDGRVLLRWSTSAVGYQLVATNALQSPPNSFAPIGPPPVVVGGKFTVTNTADGSARFYQLQKP